MSEPAAIPEGPSAATEEAMPPRLWRTAPGHRQLARGETAPVSTPIRYAEPTEPRRRPARFRGHGGERSWGGALPQRHRFSQRSWVLSVVATVAGLTPGP